VACQRRALIGYHSSNFYPSASFVSTPAEKLRRKLLVASVISSTDNAYNDDDDDNEFIKASLAAAVASGGETILVPTVRGGAPGDVYLARSSAFTALRWLSRKAFSRQGRKQRSHDQFVKGLVAHAVLISFARRQGHTELKELGDYMVSVLAFRNEACGHLIGHAKKAFQQRGKQHQVFYHLQQRVVPAAQTHSIVKRDAVAQGLAIRAQACVPGTLAARAGLKRVFDRFKHCVDLPIDSAWLRQVGQSALHHTMRRSAAFAWLSADDEDVMLNTKGNCVYMGVQ